MSLPQLIGAAGASQAPLQISGGVFNHAEGNISQHVHLAPEKEFETGFQRLHRYINGDALYNSEQRFPPPKCHPQTRLAVQEAIQSWAMSDSEEKPNVLWLYGPAGAGKSAIAQTMAERWSASGDLAGAFFFARWRNGGGDGAKLFPTLAYQFALHSLDLKRLIGRAMEEDPSICDKTLEEQARVLIRDRFLELGCGYPTPHLVVVDGLDECNSKVAQTRIIKIIFELLLATGLPHCFLICSRPEPHIRETFDSLLASGRSYRHLVLDDMFDPDRDIRLYLTASFAQLRDRLPTSPHWPSKEYLDLLVRKASGQFIYAATVLKFIDDEYSDPQERLRLVLNTDLSSNNESTSVFADLDMLYRTILSTNPNTVLVTRILGAYFALPDRFIRVGNDIRPGKALHCISFLEGILGLPVGTVRRTLRSLHSLFFIPSTDEVKITPYHASLYDFLSSESRSREFFLDSKCHHEHLLERCLEIILSNLDGSNRHCDPHSAAYSSQRWYTHFVDTRTRAQENVLTLFLGQLQDLLTPQEFSNYASMDTRIHGIIDFLNAPSRVYAEYHSTASDARTRLSNTLLLTLFNPTPETRQFYNTGESAYFSEHPSASEPPCPKVIHIQSTLGAVMRALTDAAPPWRLPQLDSYVTDPWRQVDFKPMHKDLEKFLSQKYHGRAAEFALELLLHRTTEINDRLRTPNTCKHCSSPRDFLAQRQKWSFATQWCRTLISASVPARALYDRLLELAKTSFVVWPEELDKNGLINWLKHFRFRSDSARLIAAVQDCHLRFQENDKRGVWRIFRLPPVDAPIATKIHH